MQKIAIIVVLLLLFPVLLQIGFYVFLFFLGLSLVATVAFYLARKKLLKNLQEHLGQRPPQTTSDDSETIVIDVKAERRN
ncbi:MAG: hypothetical protein IKN64_02720 [Desulfovibrio sp.]|nr:hypothetical protein [Desulfovibrio sp.]